MDSGASRGIATAETRTVEPTWLALVRVASDPHVDPMLTRIPMWLLPPPSRTHLGGHRPRTATHSEAAWKRIASESGSEYGLRRAGAESVGSAARIG